MLFLENCAPTTRNHILYTIKHHPIHISFLMPIEQNLISKLTFKNIFIISTRQLVTTVQSQPFETVVQFKQTWHSKDFRVKCK